MFKKHGITKAIWLISLVSLLTDVASEMLYPVMPVYLKTVGYSVFLIGVLEGFAEAIAGFSKSYFGRWSDASGRRLPFVRWGYLLSAVSKPMLAVTAQWWWIFLSRFLDRTGKGIRTAPRDAMLNAASSHNNKASVFGFHRMMDTTGAVLGPAIALLFLYLYPGSYQLLFILAFIPGMLAVLVTLFLKESNNSAAAKRIPPFHQTFTYWKKAAPAYKKLLVTLILFALINSSDVFLLLKIKEAGVSDTAVIGMYIFYNLVYAMAAFPLGKSADRFGMKKIFLAGLVLYAATYAGFAFAATHLHFVLLFLCYGLYAAATEGVAKAWISSLVPAAENASAIGFYTGLQSIAALTASTVAGFIWVKAGPVYVFLPVAMAAILIAVRLLISFRSPAESLK